MEKSRIDKETLLRLYTAEEKPMKEIAGLYGTSYTTVRNLIIQLGIKIRHRGGANKGKFRYNLSKEVLEDLYVNKKFSIREVSKETNINRETIRCLLLKHGIELRERTDGIRLRVLRESTK